MGTKLEYSKLLWDAQEENARRLALRANILFTIISAILGIGIPALGKLRAPLGDVWFSVPFAFISAASLASVAAAFFHLLLAPRADKGKLVESDNMASSLLFMPTQLLTEPDPVLEVAVAERTLAASEELLRQNNQVTARVDQAQHWLISGVFFLVLALLGYILVLGHPT